jgi:hypothetical protein
MRKVQAVRNSLRAASLRRVRPSEPGLIFDAQFQGDLVDRVSGQTFSFERNAAAAYERFGQVYVAPEDMPRFGDKGLLVEGEATNLFGAANRWEDWADVYHTITPNIATIQGWPIHRCTVSTDPALVWHRVNPRVNASDSDVSVGQTITDSVLVAGSSTGIVYYNVYAQGGVVSIVCRFDLDTMTVIGVGGEGGTVDNAYIKKVGDLYECSITITYSVDANAPAGWGCEPTEAGDYIDIAIMQREEGPRRTSWILNNTGEAAQTISRATESAETSGNGLQVDMDDIPMVKAALGGLVTREVLGPNLVQNGDFSAWTADSTPDSPIDVLDPDWWIDTSESPDSSIEPGANGGCRLFSPTGDYVQIQTPPILEVGKEYEISFDSLEHVAGYINVLTDLTTIFQVPTHGTGLGLTARFVAQSTDIAVKRNGVTDSTFGNVSIREVQTIVDTPTGGELIDDDTWTGLPEYWDFTEPDGATCIAGTTGTARKDILTVGKSYIVSGIASSIGGSGFRLRESVTGNHFEVLADGPYAGIVSADTDGTFRILPKGTDSYGTFTNISVKEVAPNTTVAFTFKALADSGEFSNGVGVLGFKTPGSNFNGFYFDGDTTLMQRGIANKNAIADFSAGDIVRIVQSLDSETGEVVTSSSINGVLRATNTKTSTLSSNVTPPEKLTINPTSNDKPFPMEMVGIQFWDKAMTRAEVEQEVANV